MIPMVSSLTPTSRCIVYTLSGIYISIIPMAISDPVRFGAAAFLYCKNGSNYRIFSGIVHDIGTMIVIQMICFRSS